MGADVPKSAGLAIRGGNKMHVALWFDDDEEAQALEICKRFLPDYGNSFGGTSFRDNLVLIGSSIVALNHRPLALVSECSYFGPAVYQVAFWFENHQL